MKRTTLRPISVALFVAAIAAIAAAPAALAAAPATHAAAPATRGSGPAAHSSSPPCVGAIGDRVFADLNLNGHQDAGEPGVNDVLLRLKDEAGNVVGVTRSMRVPPGQFRNPGFLNRGSGFTAPSGNGTGLVDGAYLFTGLCGGTYTIEVEPPAGSALDPTCSDGLAEGDDANCAPATVVMPGRGMLIRTIDFGLVAGCRGAIGDMVFLDANANGLLDADEGGFDGAQVTLKDATGAVVRTTTSGDCRNGRHGHYRFRGLCAGDYTVEIQVPAGHVLAAPCAADAGVDGNTDCTPAAVTLATDQSVDDSIDFGVVGADTACTGSIGDRVWNDRNQDGLQTDGEPGLNGVVVTLKDAAGATIGATCSGNGPADAAGFYTFTDLCTGDYSVEVATPSGFAPTAPCSSDPAAGDDSNCSPAAVTLAAGDAHDTSVDFGFFRNEGGEGCSHGFWKQPQHFGAWSGGYTPTTPFSAVFDDAFPGRTLLDVLWLRGGGLNALGREVVAALLNAVSPGVSYDLAPDEVIRRFDNLFPGSRDAYEDAKDRLETFNGQTCPLDGHGGDDQGENEGGD